MRGKLGEGFVGTWNLEGSLGFSFTLDADPLIILQCARMCVFSMESEHFYEKDTA